MIAPMTFTEAPGLPCPVPTVARCGWRSLPLGRGPFSQGPLPLVASRQLAAPPPLIRCTVPFCRHHSSALTVFLPFNGFVAEK